MIQKKNQTLGPNNLDLQNLNFTMSQSGLADFSASMPNPPGGRRMTQHNAPMNQTMRENFTPGFASETNNEGND